MNWIKTNLSTFLLLGMALVTISNSYYSIKLGQQNVLLRKEVELLIEINNQNVKLVDGLTKLMMESGCQEDKLSL